VNGYLDGVNVADEFEQQFEHKLDLLDELRRLTAWIVSEVNDADHKKVE
jgi:hypothetical protein